MSDEVEILKRRLAEVEAERDNLAMFRRDWYANDLPEMQRLAMWLDPDPDLPLPSLHNLVSGAMEREAEVAARLAEVERALRHREMDGPNWDTKVICECGEKFTTRCEWALHATRVVRSALDKGEPR